MKRRSALCEQTRSLLPERPNYLTEGHDDFTAEATLKKAGKVVRTKRVISKDGKVTTVTSKGTNARGETINDVFVFDKR